MSIRGFQKKQNTAHMKKLFAVILLSLSTATLAFAELPPFYADTDGDGVPNDPAMDLYPNSAPLGVAVDVYPGPGGQSSVINVHVQRGYTIQDLVDVAFQASAGNSKDYQSRIRSLAADLEGKGLITHAQADQMIKLSRPKK